MTATGWILVALGLLGMLIGFGMGTSAPGASVVNLSLMQQQMVTLTLSGFLFLAGCILIVGGSIVRAIGGIRLAQSMPQAAARASGSGARMDEMPPPPTIYTQAARIADSGVSLAGLPTAKDRAPARRGGAPGPDIKWEDDAAKAARLEREAAEVTTDPVTGVRSDERVCTKCWSVSPASSPVCVKCGASADT